MGMNVLFTTLPLMPNNNKTFAFFVSYRHAKGSTAADKFTRTFVAHLKTQVELYLPGVEVFFDKERMRAGNDMNTLAYSLCRSAAMVMIYNPLYFDLNHTWCAREYKAMLELEKKRMGIVSKQDRFIIPVIFRGGDCMPKEISDSIFCEDFDHIVADSQFKKIECQERIKAIADEICQRYMALRDAGVFAPDNCGCGQFSFPSDEEIMPWLQQVASSKTPPQMPGH